jgi:murein L,D-transpeptidase YafK
MRQRSAELRRPEVERLFAEAGVRFPPAQLLLRGFKQESELELWAASSTEGPLTHVTTFAFCFASGELGPKRREGDGQVPEGFYAVAYFHPGSSYHLALRLSYPNDADRRLGHPTAPGGDIMIHGKCVSIGCISLGDDRIEELWVAATAARDRGARVQVHLFPARDIEALMAEERFEPHRSFWRNLQEGKARFEATFRLPTVRVDAAGRYVFD